MAWNGYEPYDEDLLRIRLGEWEGGPDLPPASKLNEVGNPSHCEDIGRLLATIHELRQQRALFVSGLSHAVDTIRALQPEE